MKNLNLSLPALSFFLVCCLLPGCGGTVVAKAPEARSGVLDLRTHDFRLHGVVALKGQWEFHWSKLLRPDETMPGPKTLAAVRPGLPVISVPGAWNAHRVNDQAIGANGFGTYRLRILMPRHSTDLAIQIRDPNTAQATFWNGHLVARAGSVGKEAGSAISGRASPVGRLPDSPAEVDVVVHVSNFVHRSGGLLGEPIVGLASDLYARRDHARLVDGFLSGAMLIMGLYHLFLYIYRRKDRSALWLACVCLIIFVRVLITGERLLFEAIPGIPYGASLRLEYLSLFAAFPPLALFVHSVMPREFPRVLAYTFIALAVPEIIGAVLLPVRMASFLVPAFQVLTLVSGMVVFVAMVLAAVRGVQGTRLILAGWLAFFGSAINDILFVQFQVGPGFLAPAGLFLFILGQSAALSQRVAAAFNTSESLATNLQSALHQAHQLRSALTQREKLATVGSMAAGIVHDLKNPITAIRGYIEMADGDEVGRDNRRRYLSVVEQESDRLLAMVQDMLQYTEGSLAVDLRRVSLPDYVSRLERILAIGCEAKGIRLVMNLNTTASPMLDEGRFMRALVNIADNALDAMDRGGQLTVSFSDLGGDLVVEVVDTGPGIPEHIRSTLFDPFVTAGKEHGTGLGMAITRSLVEAHAGNIRFVTGPEGTTFTIVLPLEAQVASATMR